MPVMKVGPGRALLYSGVVPWSPALPTTDGGLLPEHWYRSDGPLWQDAGVTPAVLDGDVVGRWEDLTANADHVNQVGVVGLKPTLQNAVGDLLGGHPVIRFDGTDDYLIGPFTTGGAMNQPSTVFAVAALDAVAVDAGYKVLIDGDDNVNRHIMAQGAEAGADLWYIYAGSQLKGGVSNSSWNIWTAVYNGAVSRFWHNGVEQCAAGAGWAQNPDGIRIGINHEATGPWDGDITEVILYDANLSNADKNQIGQYLATRYGLTYTDI